MQVIINIPNKDVPNKQEIIDISLHFIDGEVCECTYPYIVLPKGHGRLIDMKKLQKFVSDYTEHDAVQLIFADREDYLPTIIEADGGGR